MPDWKARLLTKAHAHAKSQRDMERRADWPGRLQLMSSVLWMDWLKQAAALRGMSLSAYARRAVSAFIAADLGLDVTRVIAETPAVQVGLHGAKHDGLAGPWQGSAFVVDNDDQGDDH